jgi:urease subunit alpha
VFWEPAFFGIKPSLILKGGMIAMAQMGDPNASIPTPQPVHYREMFATRGGALARTSLTFVSQMAADAGIAERYGSDQAHRAGEELPQYHKAHMIHNAWRPAISVDPETYQVIADGSC